MPSFMDGISLKTFCEKEIGYLSYSTSLSLDYIVSHGALFCFHRSSQHCYSVPRFCFLSFITLEETVSSAVDQLTHPY